MRLRRSHLMVLGSVLAAACAAGAYVHSSRVFEHKLAQARATFDTRSGKALLQELAASHPHHAEVQYLYAKALRLFNEHAFVEDVLNRAAALGWPAAAIDRERSLLIAMDNFSLAEQHLRELLAEDSHDREVLLALAEGYGRSGRSPEAESLLDRVLHSHPEDGAALYLLARVLVDPLYPRYEETEADLRQAMANARERYYYPDARILLAGRLRNRGQVEEALRLYREARAEDPADFRAAYGVGLCDLLQDQPEKALHAFEEALALRPSDRNASLQIAAIYDSQGHSQEALALLRQLEPGQPNDPKLLLQMGKTLRKLGREAQAAEYQRRFDQVMAPQLTKPKPLGPKPGE